MRLLPVFVMSFALPGAGTAERMEIVICNSAALPPYVVTEAEKQAGFVFRSADIDVRWSGCETTAALNYTQNTARFLIRLRNDFVPRYGSELSLHSMGRAFVSGGEGYIADVYYPAIQELARNSQASESWLIGYTIAHEIGHLLLGPGHRLQGIMRANWGREEALALAQRWLGFDKTDQIRLRDRLRQVSLSEPHLFSAEPRP
jgi:hypothetical protein